MPTNGLPQLAQGFAECFDTIADLLCRGSAPSVDSVLRAWRSQGPWSAGAKAAFLSKVRHSRGAVRLGVVGFRPNFGMFIGSMHKRRH